VTPGQPSRATRLPPGDPSEVGGALNSRKRSAGSAAIPAATAATAPTTATPITARRGSRSRGALRSSSQAAAALSSVTTRARTDIRSPFARLAASLIPLVSESICSAAPISTAAAAPIAIVTSWRERSPEAATRTAMPITTAAAPPRELVSQMPSSASGIMAVAPERSQR
jgi:hypothetical protein